MGKKKIVGLIISFIVVAIAFYALGRSVGYNYGYNALANAMNSRGNSTDTQQKDTNSKNNNQPQIIKKVALNTAENVGDVELKVLKVKENSKISNEAGNNNAAGKFIIIEMQLKNLAKQAVSYKSSEFKLDDNGTIYTVDDNAFDALGNLNSQETIYNKNKDFIGVYDKFNPGITKKTYLVFDVPKDFNIANAKLVDSNNADIQFNLK